MLQQRVRPITKLVDIEGIQLIEPYLVLPEPYTTIIITPYRELLVEEKDGTIDRLVEYLNDDRVYPWLQNPPFPYKRHHALSWIGQLQESRRPFPSDMKTWPFAPVQSIREVVSRGEREDDVFIGDITIRRHVFEEVHDEQQRQALRKENSEKKIGDPHIVWTVGSMCLQLFYG